MIVFGGVGCPPRTCADGARYDAATNQWSPVPAGPVEGSEHSAVWTGSQMLVWGGGFGIGYSNRGAAYDPVTDAWTELSTVGAPTARKEHAAVWDGTEMLIWGGYGAGGYATDDGRYDPALATWHPISAVGAPVPREALAAVWTGTEMLVWGGLGTGPRSGAAYTPDTDTWRSMASTGAPSSRSGLSAVWTGLEMLVWGGHCSLGPCGDGAAYNPATDAWRPISRVGAPRARSEQSAVWTGTEMLVWGGQGADGANDVLGDGAAYNPLTDTWRPVPLDGAPSPRLGQVAVWTGSAMIVWGGVGPPGPDAWLNDGAVYTPPAPVPSGTGEPASDGEPRTDMPLVPSK